MTYTNDEIRQALKNWEHSFGTGTRHTIVAEAARELLRRREDPLHPQGPQEFIDWLDFTDHVARPMVEADGDPEVETATMALYQTVSPYYICASLVMAANRIRGMPRLDFSRAAQLYIDSPEAQHGDLELAQWEAEEWWRIFAQVLEEVECP